MALLLAGVVYVFLTRTDLGKALRAAADEPEAAGYQGIDVRAMHSLAFGVGIALVAAAGGLLATYHPIEPTVAVNFIVLMFVAVVLGGLGSIPGAFAGGLVIGLVQSLTLLVLPVVIIVAREAIRAVPPSIRDGALALGATKWQTIRPVLSLPAP